MSLQTPTVIRTLQRKLYRQAKESKPPRRGRLRPELFSVCLTVKPVGEPDAGDRHVRLCVQRRLVCSAGDKPAGAKSQASRSLDSRVAGNQDSEAYRQGLPWGDYESPGRNESERASGLENEWIRGPSLQLKGEGSMGCRNLTDAAPSPRRGGSDSTETRTRQATGEALLVPGRNHRSKVDRITGATGKTIEGGRVADGSAVAMKRSNVRGAKGPCCL